jgi:membrane-associated phospholipid phosphatase
MHMDASSFRWFNRLADRTPWAHGLLRFNATSGIVVFAVLLLIVFLIGRRDGDSTMLAGAVWSGAAAVIALAIGQLIGGAVNRGRPYEAMSSVHVLVSKTTDFSFPSDHATVAGAVAVGLLFANRRWGFVASVLAVLMAVTRVYVGAHSPGDVLAGLVLGGALAAVGSLTVVPLLARLVDRLATSPIRPIVKATTRAAISPTQ